MMKQKGRSYVNVLLVYIDLLKLNGGSNSLVTELSRIHY